MSWAVPQPYVQHHHQQEWTSPHVVRGRPGAGQLGSDLVHAPPPTYEEATNTAPPPTAPYPTTAPPYNPTIPYQPAPTATSFVPTAPYPTTAPPYNPSIAYQPLPTAPTAPYPTTAPPYNPTIPYQPAPTAHYPIVTSYVSTGLSKPPSSAHHPTPYSPSTASPHVTTPPPYNTRIPKTIEDPNLGPLLFHTQDPPETGTSSNMVVMGQQPQRGVAGSSAAVKLVMLFVALVIMAAVGYLLKTLFGALMWWSDN